MRRLCPAATLWCIVLGTLAAQEKPALEGIVRDSVTGQPLARAAVKINGGNEASQSSSTDDSGAFRFPAIGPGEYRVYVTRRGYTKSPAATVHVDIAAKLAPLAIALDPEASISGRVIDEADDPVARMSVSASAETWEDGLRRYREVTAVETDEHGNYRLTLPAGRYYVRTLGNAHLPEVFVTAPGEPEMKYVSTFYPGASSIESATALSLHAGQQVNGIDLKLRPMVVYHVRGTVQPNTPQTRGVWLGLVSRAGDLSTLIGGTMERDGNFDIRGVLPGSYSLQILRVNTQYSGRLPVEVADRDRNGVALTLSPAFTLKGHITPPAEARPPRRLTIKLLNAPFAPFERSLHPSAAGEFQIQDVPPDDYAVSLLPAQDLYIESIFYNQRRWEGGRVQLAGESAGPLDIVLSSGTGQISGTVKSPPENAKLVAILASAPGQTGSTGARIVELGPPGHFDFRFVPPGRYYVWAAPVFDEGLWQNADFLRELASSGVTVDLEKKGSVQVEVPVTDAAQILQAMEKVK